MQREVRLAERAFGLRPSILGEVMRHLEAISMAWFPHSHFRLPFLQECLMLSSECERACCVLRQDAEMPDRK